MEIVKVERIGSIVICQGTVHCHKIQPPFALLADRSTDGVLATVDVGNEMDRQLGSSSLPPGIDVSQEVSMTARALIALLCHSLRRASSGIANLSNNKPFCAIRYMDYNDVDMDGFLYAQ